MHIACQIPELCDYPVTAETRQHVAIFLARLYDDMVISQYISFSLVNFAFFAFRCSIKDGRFTRIVWIKYSSMLQIISFCMLNTLACSGLLSDIDKRENRIKLAALLITLLQGPVDTGISLVTNDTVTNIMLQMAASGDSLEQVLLIKFTR